MGAANSGESLRSPQNQDQAPASFLSIAPSAGNKAEASSYPRVNALGPWRMFLWLFSLLFFHKEPTTLHSSFQICSSSCGEINNTFWTFQMQSFLRLFLSFFFFTLSLFPFSRLKKSAEVTTHNGQACVIDQMPPTPRPVDKSAFVHCILGGTPWACPNPAGECSANFFPTLSQGSGFGPGPSCVNPRPDKTQHKRKGECSPKEPLC